MTQLSYDRLFIGGAWIPPASRQRIRVFSPSSEEEVGSVPEAAAVDIDRAVAAARQAFDDPTGWPRWSPEERAAVLVRFADELSLRSEEMAQRVTSQNGMPITLARKWEATQPAKFLRYYAELAIMETEDLRHGIAGRQHLVLREAVGVVGAIVPWNVPQSISFLKLAPALAAGCTIVLKPAPETVLDAFLVAEAAEAARLPAGVLNIVPAGSDGGSYLVEHPGIDKVSFTGSTGAGRAIAEACGRLLRPVTLELGGKSAAIVLDDADLASDIDSFLHSTMSNNGQVCWLSTRVLVPQHRYTEVVDLVTDAVGSLRIGDPLRESTQVGPLVSERQRARVEGYIATGVGEGGTITVGGGRPGGLARGWYVQPTVFRDVRPENTIARQEIFGPVLTLVSYTDDSEAVAIANDSEYGLGGSVWTSDPDRGERIARQIRTGTISVNRFQNDLVAPFGGIKSSGLGREMGPEGMDSFRQFKTVHLDRPPSPCQMPSISGGVAA